MARTTTLKTCSKRKGYVQSSHIRGLLQEALLLPFAAEIELALIYGSMAKGSETATSDIDLLIVSDTLTFSTVLESVIPAETQLGRPIHAAIYSRAEFQKKREAGNHFLTSVLGQATITLFGNPHV